MIDLHLHTSASDGALSPADLVARVARAGLTTISITDHDTTGGLEGGARAAYIGGLTKAGVQGLLAAEHIAASLKG